ncbi:serine/threonine-protein kinase unc-51 isoform X2 [Neocloeon triangulifer]|uniref:serine/threonine-protein kinase unc-51 isoform X2 n=1 Tax=Neocloeon triangulifer TaxID=2078957 RepID=UPI00286EDBA3|nr:serine/threonine-protein kinase unc-51 isoform X2 [Neocloeon triangulifer]
MTEEVGDFEYNSNDLIGHGAFAVVFKGRKRKGAPCVVAIKRITKKNLAKSQNLLGKEIKILKELTELHHDNVVALLDCKETATYVYLVMEYCNGGDLADYLNVKGTLSEDTTRLFLRQLAGAMKALHAKGIVHRDLKPQNILLSHNITCAKSCPQPHEIRLKIADFGFARFLQDGVMAATLCGSPMYMAPEVIMSLQYDAKADLWSLGTIVFQCLTGKAPFQAQTPQALKLYYEKNANLAPKIPLGTSQELSDLLMGLLKRNACDRMDFDHFFDHTFLNKGTCSAGSPKSVTAPMAVPARKQTSPMSMTQGISAGSPSSNNTTPSSSPIPGHLPPSPGSLLYQDVAKSPTHHNRGEELCISPSSIVSMTATTTGQNLSISLGHDDFVLVSNHIVYEENPSEISSVTLARKSGTEFSDFASRSPKSGFHKACFTQSSPPRPSFLPVSEQSGASNSVPRDSKDGTKPIPVPTQRNAYQQIHGIHRSDNNNVESSTENITLNSVPRSRPISMRRQSEQMNNAEINSISPPAVQFTMGTPPGAGRHRSASGSSCGTPPPVTTWQVSPVTHYAVLASSGRHGTPNSSPMRRSGVSSSPLLFAQGATGLPPILGSPTRIQAAGFDNACYQGGDRCGNLPSDWMLLSPFVARAVTLPDLTTTENESQRRPNCGLFPDQSDVFGESSPQAGAAAVEGPITFIAPELPEETLLEREHNETLAKLNFVLALVDCVIELARSRATPLQGLAESVAMPQAGSPGSPGQGNQCTDGQRRAEQLVLLVRALQLLSSGLNLANQELKAGRLQPSFTVKNVVSKLNEKFHYCLTTCKQLNMPSLLQRAGVDPNTSITADRILYNYAIEMCQSAALDELFGNPQDCFHRYQTAQILLHSLSQQVQHDHDKALLSKYKDAVEKRLFVLQQQGYIYAYDSA